MKTATRKPAKRTTAASKPATRKNGAKAAPAAAAAQRAGEGPAYKFPVKRNQKNKDANDVKAVEAFQYWLRKRVDPTLKIDGQFGARTWHCAQLWQKDHPSGREISEMLGQYTWHSLVNNVK